MGQRDKGRGEREELWMGGGGLLALPPGVLSSCQEANRFPLSGLECACSVFACTSGTACPFICSTRPGELSPLMVGVHLTESLLLLPIASSKLIENMQTNKWNHDER